MPRSRVGLAARVAAVAMIVGGSSLYGSGADAGHSIVFPPCTTPPPSQSPAPTAPVPTTSPNPVPTATPYTCAPEAGEIIRGSRVVRFEVHQPQNQPQIREVIAVLDPATDGRGPITVPLTCAVGDADPAKSGCQYDPAPPASTSLSYSFTWNSVALTPYNDAYTLRVIATARPTDSSQSHTATKEIANLRVDNPPATPKAPRILVATESSVAVQWDKAPELDVVSYTLYRAYTGSKDDAPSDGAFRTLTTTATTSFRDEVPKPGAYWYKVRVDRRSVVAPSKVISSALSARSGAGVVRPFEEEPAAKKKATNKAPSARATAEPSKKKSVIPRAAGKPPAVPEAPFSVVLPYDDSNRPGAVLSAPEEVPEQRDDPRGTVLPVAVGAFLVSSALALGRMPY